MSNFSTSVTAFLLWAACGGSSLHASDTRPSIKSEALAPLSVGAHYRGKLAVIVGGSEGIGLAIAKEMASLGAHVLIAARTPEKLRLARTEIKAARLSSAQFVIARAIDVADRIQVEERVASWISSYGVPDILVNCAGFAHPGYLDQMNVTDLDAMIDVNLRGTIYVTHAFTAHMIRLKRGSIANTSSVAGFISVFGNSVYSATKFGVIGFSQALRAELRPYGINVSVLCPPNTRTPGLDRENETKPDDVLALEEKARVVSPEEVARHFVRALPRGPFLIIPTLDSRFFYWTTRLSPGLVEYLTRRPKLPKTAA